MASGGSCGGGLGRQPATSGAWEGALQAQVSTLCPSTRMGGLGVEKSFKNTFVQILDWGMSNRRRPKGEHQTRGNPSMEDPDFDLLYVGKNNSMLHAWTIANKPSSIPYSAKTRSESLPCWRVGDMARSLAQHSRPPPACQVLGQVEAHISALRAQLKPETIGVSSLTDGGDGGCPSSPPTATSPNLGDAAGVVGTAVANDVVSPAVSGGSRDGANTGTASLSIETRGNYHLSPAPAERSGNEGKLSELEDMRLNRLLRSSGCSSSTTPMSGGRKTLSTRHPGGSPNRGDAPGLSKMTDQGEPGIDFESPGRIPAGRARGVSRELFGGSPVPECGGYGGSWQSWENGTSFEAVRGELTGREDREDDLEDISDGGFHSGCWRRKYVRGEMR